MQEKWISPPNSVWYRDPLWFSNSGSSYATDGIVDREKHWGNKVYKQGNWGCVALFYTSILNYCQVTWFYEGISFYIPYTIVFNLLVYQWETEPSASVDSYTISLFVLCPFTTRIPTIKPILRMVSNLLILSTHKNFIICEQWPLETIKENWKWQTEKSGCGRK